MFAVFNRSGFPVQRRLEQGVVHLTLTLGEVDRRARIRIRFGATAIVPIAAIRAESAQHPDRKPSPRADLGLFKEAWAAGCPGVHPCHFGVACRISEELEAPGVALEAAFDRAASSSASLGLSQTTPISVLSSIERGSRLSEPMNTACRSKTKVFCVEGGARAAAAPAALDPSGRLELEEIHAAFQQSFR
jgi:hypothetical protein